MAINYEPLPTSVKLGTVVKKYDESLPVIEKNSAAPCKIKNLQRRKQQVYNGKDKIKSEKHLGTSANNLMYCILCVGCPFNKMGIQTARE
jgi:hypothetical protein